jgi:hypothetical protein
VTRPEATPALKAVSTAPVAGLSLARPRRATPLTLVKLPPTYSEVPNRVDAGVRGGGSLYPEAPSLTWSPASSPVASRACCPLATRSGIMGPSPEGSRTPSSTQV